ncbi:OmpA family protein [Pedobacter ginsengisoli]|uniref:OmpA family protein n=1 Tax=Pedobacter ginsengisoli TaxID=363852 RepID=UPI00254DB41B|nr:OmpA family protein [Pedobacter ginsengisoli]
MKKLILISALLLAGNNLMAQGFLNKLKQKAEDMASKTVDKGLEGKAKKNTEATSTSREPIKPENASGTPTTSLASTTTYDFVPGSKILLADNFAQDALGQFPLKWYTRSKGEVVTLNTVKGNWLRLYPGTFVSPVVNIGENATIEFDLIMNWPATGGYLVPAINFAFYDRGNKGEILSYDYRLKNCLRFGIAPYRSEAAVQLTSFENVAKKLESDKYRVANFDRKAGNVIHVAISIQNERVRIWLDQEKVFDLPQAAPLNGNLNQLKIDMSSSNYTNEQLGYYVSNFKFAEGSADNRSKLLTTGRLETSGILFAINSAEVKSDNEGTIKEVATAMTENPDLKIKIIGHTDAVGKPDANLILSIKRAESVRDALVKIYKIDAGRMETEGRGSTAPVSDDNSEAGKTSNRRVEFIKL